MIAAALWTANAAFVSANAIALDLVLGALVVTVSVLCNMKH
jgi:hypothetical protein